MEPTGAVALWPGDRDKARLPLHARHHAKPYCCAVRRPCILPYR